MDGKEDEYNIVFFSVEPLSVKHNFEPIDKEKATAGNVATFINPIESCNRGSSEKTHTDYSMVETRDPQEAAGKVLFTYVCHPIPSLYLYSALLGIESQLLHSLTSGCHMGGKRKPHLGPPLGPLPQNGPNGRGR